MATLTRPGIYIDESQFPTYTPSAPGNALAAFVAPHPRGPTAPTQINSWNDFVAYYGGFDVSYPPSNLALAIYSYFSAGGTSAIVIRAIASSSGPTTASITLNDTQGSPASTLRISAANPGLWGTSLYVDVIAGNYMISGVAQSFTLVVKYGGTGNGNVVERWENLTMVPSALGSTIVQGSNLYGASNYAIDIVNSSLTGSRYIVLQDMASSATGIIKNPALQTGTQLTGGTDGNAPSLGDVSAALALLDQFPDQPFLLNIPGGYDATDIGNAITYAEGRNDCFVVADTPSGLTAAGAASFQATLPASSYCALYAPWIRIADPYAVAIGRTRLVPPAGAVMGVYARTDGNRGVAKTPAGLQSSIPAALGVETSYSNADLATLTQANVNPLQSIPSAGIVVMGGRTLSNLLITRYITVRRSLIYLRTQFVAMTKFAIFEPNDWVLWNLITSVLSQFLLSFWQSGGLNGSSSSQAFYVLCDASNNTPNTIQQGIVNVEIGVALERPAEFIVIKLGQSAASTQLTSV